jgi:hypothetical protein
MRSMNNSRPKRRPPFAAAWNEVSAQPTTGRSTMARTSRSIGSAMVHMAKAS